ncbi:hypothetical protein ACJJI4_01340 [Microbulbifer sp. TRSA002]|uniref:hypothetical protein n=1 Tax=Microbulbifer sp. TRSA002 TaxID=3243382 RepID=UPI00403A39AE
MRNNSETFDVYNQAPQRQLRLVIEIDYDLPLYISSHTDIPGLPANVILGTLKKCSATSQKIIPEQGLAEIGAISFEVVDIAAQLSYVLRDELEQGRGIKGRTVRLYQGFAGLDWEDFRLEQTQIAEESISYASGIYRVRCRDIQRAMRSDIFVLNSTRLSADFLKSADTLPVYDASEFEPNPHTAAYGDAWNQSVYYLKIKYQDGFEIVRATGKTDSSFTGCTRGLFGTHDRDHILPEDSDDESGIEVEEYIYLEGPGPQLAYALLTGNILGTNDALPSNWHLGIDPNYVVLDQFENIGSDWYKPSDHSKGKILRFDGLEKTDGKKFIETEINLLLGAFMPVNAAGQLGFRRMAGVLADSGSVSTISPDDVTNLGELKYNLAGIRNVFSVEWSWFEQPGFDGKYLRTNHVLDADSIAVHGEAKQHTLAFRGLHNSRHTYTTIKNTFDALRDRCAGPPLSLRLGLLPSKNDLEVGDIVRVSLPQLRDHSIRGDRPYDFNFASDAEGWTPRDGITASSVSNGVLSVNVLGENPWISRSFSPTFPGADLPYLKLRIRRTSDEPIAVGTGSKLFFKHTGSSSYFSAGANEMLDLIERMNNTKDEWQDLVLDLTQESDWTGGDIELIRIDIGHDHTADYSYELDYIRLVPTLGLDEYSLDRAMEVQRVSINQVTGAVSVDLFGSFQPAGMIADQAESTSAELPDAWYQSEGTAMTAAGLAIDADGFLTADGTLAGNADSRAIYYHTGDLTIPAGSTLSVSNNVELRVRGVLQIDGELKGLPSNSGVGFLGSCYGGAGQLKDAQTVVSRGTARGTLGQTVIGRNAVMPPLDIENNGGDLQGIPDDLRGSGGARGGHSSFYAWDGSYEPSGRGGVGGDGGAGLVVIARGIAIGVSGRVENSGEDGSPGSTGEENLIAVPGGSGGGGAPGGIVLLVDGTSNPMPVLSNNKITACYGDSPTSPGNAGQGSICLGTNAVRLLFVPKSRSPYPDHEDPALDPDLQATLDAAERAQADATAALEDLDDIAADGKLHPSEKLQVIREHLQLTEEQAGINSEADKYGVVLERGDYDSALAVLDSYLQGLSPDWDDSSQATPISRTIWNANWTAVYSARQELLNRIAGVAREASQGARFLYGKDLRSSPEDWPQNSDYDGSNKYTFSAVNNETGSGYLHVLLFDAEGVELAFNGSSLGSVVGPNNALRWYGFPVDIVAGDNEVAVWAANSDGGSVRAVVVTQGGLGDPETMLDALAAREQADSAQTAAEDAQSDATAALADLGNIAADGKLHPSEKVQVNREYNDLISQQAGIESQANELGISTEKTNYSNAISALTSYLQGLSPTWNATNSTTNIVRSTWNGKWQDVYSYRQVLLNAISAFLKSRADNAQSAAETADSKAVAAQNAVYSAQTDATAALQDLDDIAADGKLHPTEKKQAVLEYQSFLDEQNGIAANASQYSELDTLRSDYTAAITALTNYLLGLTPAWSDTSQVTPISRSIWNTNWAYVYEKRQTLLLAINDSASSRATWDGISGPDKPEANATKNIVGYNESTGEFTNNGILLGSMQSARRAELRALQASASVFIDAFTDTLATADWPIVAGNSEDNIYYVKTGYAGAQVGGKVLRIGGNDSGTYADDGEAWIEFKERFPFDPDELYRIKARVWVGNEGDTDRKLYVGVSGFRDDGTRCNTSGNDEYSSQHYVACSGVAAAGDGWQEYTGYFQGNASANAEINPTGENTIAQPAKLQADVRYFSPYVVANYGGDKVGRTQLDYVRIDKVEPTGNGLYLKVNTNAGLGDNASPGEAQLCGFDAHGNPGGNLPGWFLWGDQRISIAPVSLNPSLSGQFYIVTDTDGAWGENNSAMPVSIERGQYRYHYFDGSIAKHTYFTPTEKMLIIGEIYLSGNEVIAGGGIYQNPRPLIGFAQYMSGLNENGQIADQRSLQQNIGSIASLPTSNTVLSASDDGSTAKITIAAYSVQYAGFTVSYNSGSITGLSFSTTYYVYVDDLDYAGGGVTYYVTQQVWQLSAAPGRRAVGTIKTPANGGGTTIPTDPWCVAEGSWLREDLLVDDCEPGDLIDCWETGDGHIHQAPIVRVEKEPRVLCVLLTMSCGAQVICSRETPVTDREGRVYWAQDCQGVELGVLHKDEPLTWEIVERVECAGLRTVHKLSVGGKSYAAGLDPQHRVITHNGVYKSD